MSREDGQAGDRTVIDPVDPRVGTVLDQRFRIDFALAAGGFGAVYLATDVGANAEVALKVLHPQLAQDPKVVERFRREGATLASLRDPHTVTAYQLGEAADGTLYIVMELLHGESLYHRFRARGPLPWRRVVHIARGVCSSLAEAHAAGIVHRDLKPANIHLETRGNDADFVKVLDFGIAKIAHGGEDPEPPWGPERGELTLAGQMIGTVDYMSPEQMVGDTLTGRSDIYAIGVVMYEMISGRTPFAGEPNATAMLAAVLTRTPEALSRHAAVPPRLDQIVSRCLQRDARHRFASITELADALAEVANTADTEPAGPATAPAGAPSPAVDRASLDTELLQVDRRAAPRAGLDAGTRDRHSHPPPARGSQHVIDLRGFQPLIDGRGSQPLIDRGAWDRYRRDLTPLLPGVPAAPIAHGGYDVAASGSHAATLRRLIGAALVLALAIVALVLAAG